MTGVYDVVAGAQSLLAAGALVARKELLLPATLAVCIMSLFASIIRARWAAAWAAAGGGGARPGGPAPVLNMAWASSWLVSAALALWCGGVLAARSLPTRAVDALAAIICAAVILGDWGQASHSTAQKGEMWPWGYIAMHILLTAKGGRAATGGCFAALIAWAVVRSVEDAVRVGLWDFPYRTGKAAEPTGARTLPLMLCIRIVPFALDVWFTRRFATRLEGAITLSSVVAQALASYDLAAARAALGS
eukprot:gene1165-91_t